MGESEGPGDMAGPAAAGRSGSAATAAVGWAHGALVLAYTLWGLSGVVAQELMRGHGFPPLHLVAVRMVLSGLVMVTALGAWRPGMLRLAPREWPGVVAWGVAGLGLMQWSFYTAIRLTNVPTATFLQYLAPVLLTAWAYLVERRRFGPAFLWAAVLGVGGVGLLAAGMPQDGGPVSSAGLAIGLFSAGTHAFYLLMGAWLVRRIHPLTLFTWGTLAGSLFWLVLVPVGPVWHSLAGGVPLLLIIHLVMLASVAPFCLSLYGLAHVHPVQAVIIGTLEPVISAVAAWSILGEALGGWQILGAGLVVAAVWLTTARQYQRGQVS